MIDALVDGVTGNYLLPLFLLVACVVGWVYFPHRIVMKRHRDGLIKKEDLLSAENTIRGWGATAIAGLGAAVTVIVSVGQYADGKVKEHEDRFNEVLAKATPNLNAASPVTRASAVMVLSHLGNRKEANAEVQSMLKSHVITRSGLQRQACAAKPQNEKSKEVCNDFSVTRDVTQSVDEMIRLRDLHQVAKTHENRLRFGNAYLNKSDFDGYDLVHAEFSNTDLYGATFIKADLSKAAFNYARMDDWQTPWCTLAVEGARTGGCYGDFMDANLTDASFMGAGIIGARFCGANLRRTTFEATNLTRVSFLNALNAEDLVERLKKGKNCSDGGTFGPDGKDISESLNNKCNPNAEKRDFRPYDHFLDCEKRGAKNTYDYKEPAKSPAPPPRRTKGNEKADGGVPPALALGPGPSGR